MAEVPIFVPLGQNLIRHWTPTGRRGEGVVTVAEGATGPILVRWEEYSFDREGFARQPPQVLGRFFHAGAPLRPTKEIHKRSHTGNLGTTHETFEALAPEGLVCTEWFTPEGAVRSEALRVEKDRGLWTVRCSSMTSGTVFYHTVVYVHVESRFFFDLPRMEVASYRQSHVDDST